MQVKWGSHGDYEIIALAPWSVQECFDMMIDAFNLSERWRIPVVVLADETVVHLKEKLIIPPADQIKRINRKKASGLPEAYLPFKAGTDLVPPMASFGTPYRFYVSGLFAFMTPRSRTVAAFWRKVESQRKRPWRIFATLGWWPVFKYLLGRLSLQEALARISSILEMKIGVVILPFADAAVDVDTEDDWRLVQQILAEKE